MRFVLNLSRILILSCMVAVGLTVDLSAKSSKKSFSPLTELSHLKTSFVNKAKGFFSKNNKKKPEEEIVAHNEDLVLETDWIRYAVHLGKIAVTPLKALSTDMPRYLNAVESSVMGGEITNVPDNVLSEVKKGSPIWRWPLSDVDSSITMESLALSMEEQALTDGIQKIGDEALAHVWARFLGLEEMLTLSNNVLLKEQTMIAIGLIQDLTQTISGNKKLKLMQDAEKKVDGGLGRLLERMANWGLVLQKEGDGFLDYHERRGDEWVNRMLTQFRLLPDTPESKECQTKWVIQALSEAVIDERGEGFKHMFELLPADYQASCAHVQWGDFKKPLLVAGYELIAQWSPETAEQFRSAYSRWLPTFEKVSPVLQGIANAFGGIPWDKIVQMIHPKKNPEEVVL